MVSERMGNPSTIHEDTYEKWRNAIFKTDIVCALTILLMEIIMFFVLGVQDLRRQPAGEYLARFVILPSVCNFLMLVIGYGLMQKWKEKKWALNYIPIVMMVLNCFSLSVFHNIFSILFCTFSFPIFLSIIFSDKKMTEWITMLSFLCLTSAQVVGPIVSDVESRYLISTYLISVASLFCTHVISSVLLQAQKQKDRKLEVVYKSRTEALEKLKYDQKTGLYGHTSFQTGLHQMVEKNKEIKNPAIAVLDIDDFKQVNDTYGHVKGDIVLIEIAHIMQKVCGERYSASRVGGEEFAILFQNGTMEEYIEVVETVRKEFEKVSFEFRKEPVTISAGLAMWQDEWGVTEFFDKADEALYNSKHQGKNRTTVCDENGMQTVEFYQWMHSPQADKIK